MLALHRRRLPAQLRRESPITIVVSTRVGSRAPSSCRGQRDSVKRKATPGRLRSLQPGSPREKASSPETRCPERPPRCRR